MSLQHMEIGGRPATVVYLSKMGGGIVPAEDARVAVARFKDGSVSYFFTDTDKGNGRRPRAAAARPLETLVHRAADANVQKVYTAARYIFTMGRRAIDKNLLRDAIAQVRTAAFNPDQPRDEYGRWSDLGSASAPNTPEFKSWFRESKVVDDSGKPLIVHHSGSFDELENIAPTIGAEGMHFGTMGAAIDRMGGKPIDEMIKSIEVDRDEETGRYHYRVENGAIDSYDTNEDGFDSEEEARQDAVSEIHNYASNDYGGDEAPPITSVFLSIQNPKRVADAGGDWSAVVAKAKAEGHDGLIYYNRVEDKGSISYVVFSPEQIKSVKNKGQFNPNSSFITLGSPDQPRDEFGRWTSDGSLSSDDVAAVDSYHIFSMQLNSDIREGKTLDPEQQRVVKGMDRAARSAKLEEDTTLYRSVPSHVVADLKPGDTYTDKAFLSTSKSRESAEDLVGITGGDDRVIEILAPAGTRGLDINATLGERSAFEMQNEVVLPRDTRMRVVSVDGDRIRMQVERNTELRDSDVQNWTESVRRETGADVLKMHLTSKGDLSLDYIGVDKQGQGIGSRAMHRLTSFADSHGRRMVVSPASSQRDRLVAFYNRFGFIENSDRRYRHVKKSDMVREPVLVRAAAKSKVERLLDAAEKAVHDAALRVMPKMIEKIVINGGDAAVRMLKNQLRVLEFRSAKKKDAKKGPTIAPLKMRFDAPNSGAAKWAKKHATELAKELAKTTRERIRNAVAQVHLAGDLDEAYESILQAVGDDARAMVIARTETMIAANEGQREAWAQAVEDDLLPEDVQRTWIVTEVGACPLCLALEGAKADLDGEYPGDGGEGPPLHPNCRCTEGIAA